MSRNAAQILYIDNHKSIFSTLQQTTYERYCGYLIEEEDIITLAVAVFAFFAAIAKVIPGRRLCLGAWPGPRGGNMLFLLSPLLGSACRLLKCGLFLASATTASCDGLRIFVECEVVDVVRLISRLLFFFICDWFLPSARRYSVILDRFAQIKLGLEAWDLLGARLYVFSK